jgi:hypothetical protein
MLQAAVSRAVAANEEQEDLLAKVEVRGVTGSRHLRGWQQRVMLLIASSLVCAECGLESVGMQGRS